MCRRERVRHAGVLGWTHYIHPNYVNLQLDNGCYISLVPLDQVEFVDMLKLNKPLQMLTHGGDPKDVKILGEDTDGHLIINTYGTGKDSHWVIFDKNGKFVRSTTGGGSALSLRNTPDAITHRFTINITDGVPYFSPTDIGMACDVQIIVSEGKVQSITPRADFS
jgi:hypothetical protein